MIKEVFCTVKTFPSLVYIPFAHISVTGIGIWSFFFWPNEFLCVCKYLNLALRNITFADVTKVLCELELIIKKVKVSTTPDGKVMDLFFITDTRWVFFLFPTLFYIILLRLKPDSKWRTVSQDLLSSFCLLV